MPRTPAQETWLRLTRSEVDAINDICGWLTAVTGRICLDLLRVRVTRGQQPLVHLPDPIVSPAEGSDPEHEALLEQVVEQGHAQDAGSVVVHIAQVWTGALGSASVPPA